MEYNPLSTTLTAPLAHGYKRTRDDLHDLPPSSWPKKRSKTSVGLSSSASSSAAANLSSNNHSGEISTSSSSSSSSPSIKNALMLLHELKPSVEYKLIAQTGPSHRPIFTMAVEVNGQTFEGMAQTKKEAKQAGNPFLFIDGFRLSSSLIVLYLLAAEKALRSFSDLPFPLPDDVTHHAESNTMIQSESDANTHFPCVSSAEIDETNVRTTSVSPQLNEPREIQSGYSPLYLLNQLKRDAQFEEITDESTSSTTDGQGREFKFAVIIDGQRFYGSGRNKKIAKTRAAQVALEKLFGMCFDKEGK